MWRSWLTSFSYCRYVLSCPGISFLLTVATWVLFHRLMHFRICIHPEFAVSLLVNARWSSAAIAVIHVFWQRLAHSVLAFWVSNRGTGAQVFIPTLQLPKSLQERLEAPSFCTAFRNTSASYLYSPLCLHAVHIWGLLQKGQNRVVCLRWKFNTGILLKDFYTLVVICEM